MSSSFTDSFDQIGEDSQSAGFIDSCNDGYLGSDPSQRFDSFSNFTESEPAADTSSPPPIYVSGGVFSSDPGDFLTNTHDNGPILLPPVEMEPEGGYALSEWRLWAHSLTVDDYQALLDRGWRRSGIFLYQPEMEKTCCPSYTIRLKASDFVPSKEQLRVSKRMQRFLDGMLDVKSSGKLLDEQNSSGGSCSNTQNLSTSSDAKESVTVDCEDKDETDKFMHHASMQIDSIVQSCMEYGEFFCNIQLPKASVKKVIPAKRKLQAEVLENLNYSCNIAFQIAAIVRRSKKDAEHGKPLEHGVGGNRNSSELSPKMIAEILASHLTQLAESSGLSLRACNGHINFYSATKQAPLVEEGKISTISTQFFKASGGNGCLKTIRGHPKDQKRMFEIRLKRSTFDDEEYALYRKYQLRVHNDTPDHVTESSYKRFLVDTP